MREDIRKLLKRALTEGVKKKSYLGQCDLVRRKCDINETYWHEMMKNKKRIPFTEFVNSVEISAILDDDETPNGFINDSLRQDPETAAYVSNWGDKEAMFLQVAGFEFIFV